MAGKRKAPAKAKTTKPELVFDEGHYWIVQGTKRLDVGRSKRFAEKMLADLK